MITNVIFIVINLLTDVLFFAYVNTVGVLAAVTKLSLVLPMYLNEFLRYLTYFNGFLPMWPDPTSSGLYAHIGIIDLFAFGLLYIELRIILKIALLFLHFIPFISPPEFTSMFNSNDFDSEGAYRGSHVGGSKRSVRYPWSRK